eukprot:CAMPEP_0113940174 /NCGR_PEP_ID=MMETSP1339-20121228/6345_1 /TAXON_ID=94617 /ORGANISM="Fibrocapsa japonica" /LENGTH=383 /DNA_ID=CAMNT_0000943893 /DNA_START=61 /DNA_END=1213 /DNA_ORIENTATION=- /assembly_acc=CAM_ASM_000762
MVYLHRALQLSIGISLAITNQGDVVSGQDMATTTRYWDCSGGACGCAYLPYDDPMLPAHCHSNAMFEAPEGNPYGAKFYGTAAVSQVLFDDSNGDSWLGNGCGKCWKVTGTSNTPGFSGVRTTLVLKGANYCPPENAACSGNKAHFDIAAPGFDVTAYSFAHTCPEREPEEAEGFAACGSWMINDSNPEANCDCSKFKSEVLRAGCENFLSLQWNNAIAEYEEVSCPMELDRLNCWEENGGGYPVGIPEFCAVNLDGPSPTTPTVPTPTSPPVSTPSSPPAFTPTSPPVPTPTSPPVPTPTSPPVSGPAWCCSHDFKACSSTDPTNWCNLSQTNCEGACSGLYIPDAPEAVLQSGRNVPLILVAAVLLQLVKVDNGTNNAFDT